MLPFVYLVLPLSVSLSLAVSLCICLSPLSLGLVMCLLFSSGVVFVCLESRSLSLYLTYFVSYFDSHCLVCIVFRFFCLVITSLLQLCSHVSPILPIILFVYTVLVFHCALSECIVMFMLLSWSLVLVS